MRMNTFAAASALLVAALSPAQADHTIVDMQINGMVCAYCAAGIESALKKREDVASIEVDMDQQRVSVESTPGDGPSNDELRALVRHNGYNVATLERYAHSRDAEPATVSPDQQQDAPHHHSHDQTHDQADEHDGAHAHGHEANHD